MSGHGHKKVPKLDGNDRDIIIKALGVAAESYETSEKTFRQIAEDISNGKNVMMFAPGEAGVKTAKSMADQQYRQAQSARHVLAKFEDDEG